MQSFEDYNALIHKYGSAEHIENLEQLGSMSESELEQMFNFMMSTSPALEEIDLENIDESVDGDSAELNMETKDGSMSATVSMVEENGNWKMQEEAWTVQS